jgi:hypothetical protein
VAEQAPCGAVTELLVEGLFELPRRDEAEIADKQLAEQWGSGTARG